MLLSTGTLDVWLKEFYLLLPLYHQLLVDLGDDAGGSPVVALNVAYHISCSVCRRIYSNHTAVHVYSVYYHSSLIFELLLYCYQQI